MTSQTSLALGGSSGVGSSQNRGPTAWFHEIDIADAATVVTTGGYTAVLNIPADTLVTVERFEIVEAVSLDSSTSGRIDLGDSSDDDQFISNLTTFTAGTDGTIVDSRGSPVGAYTAADSIRLKLTGDKLAGGTANATGKVRAVGTIMSTARNAPMETVTP